MASTKTLLEENKKLNPRYALELYTIRLMIQEANMLDQSLRTFLGPQVQLMHALPPVIRAQDSLHERQLNMLVGQGQQLQDGFVSRVGRDIHPPGMNIPQGQGSLQQYFIEPPPSVPPTIFQYPASQPTPPGWSQIHGLHNKLVEMPISQLSGIYAQLVGAVEKGKKHLNAAGGTGGESDIQALLSSPSKARQLLIDIRHLIKLKRQGYA